jgi:hypothetical protein
MPAPTSIKSAIRHQNNHHATATRTIATRLTTASANKTPGVPPPCGVLFGDGEGEEGRVCVCRCATRYHTQNGARGGGGT